MFLWMHLILLFKVINSDMLKIALSSFVFLLSLNAAVCNSFFTEIDQRNTPKISSDSVLVSVTADQNAFMCPFLTPMFMEKLKKSNAISLRKEEDLSIHFTLSKAEFSEDMIYKIAENVGYMRTLIHIEHRDK